jgi:hypothetical protein
LIPVENDETALKEEEEKSKEIYETFRRGTFEEIVAKSEAKVGIFFIPCLQFETPSFRLVVHSVFCSYSPLSKKNPPLDHEIMDMD